MSRKNPIPEKHRFTSKQGPMVDQGLATQGNVNFYITRNQ